MSLADMSGLCFLCQSAYPCQLLPRVNGVPVSECRVGGGAQSSGLASVRRSNPACGSPALGFHKGTLRQRSA